jgi:ESCRT-II complex subunit VPS25
MRTVSALVHRHLLRPQALAIHHGSWTNTQTTSANTRILTYKSRLYAMSSSASLLTTTTNSTTPSYNFPPHYSFPPFFTLQPNPLTRSSQLASWETTILTYCRFHKIYQLSIVESFSTPLFTNSTLSRKLSIPDIRTVLEHMSSNEGGNRVEWTDKSKTKVWVWWRKPEEWADIIYAWVEGTGQKGSVLTVWEISQGDGSRGSELHGLDAEVVNKSLQVLVKRGKAQIFGEGEGKGVKFF